jgi:YD repeat-containing protein
MVNNNRTGYFPSKMLLCFRNLHVFCFLKLLILLFVCNGWQACAQGNTGQTGIVPSIPYGGDNFDSVNMSNGYQTFIIPLISYPQLGKLQLNYIEVMPSVHFTPTEKCYGCQSGTPGTPSTDPISCTIQYNGTMPGFQRTTTPGYGLSIKSIDLSTWNCVKTVGDYPTCFSRDYYYNQYNLADGTGAQHSMGWDPSTNYTTLRSLDGSGLAIIGANPKGWGYGTDYQGMIVYPNGVTTNSGTFDPSGNSITKIQTGTDASGGALFSIKDSVGRMIPESGAFDSTPSTRCPIVDATNQSLYSSEEWDVPGPNGSSLNYTFCYTWVNYHTNFLNHKGQQRIVEMKNDNGTHLTEYTYNEAVGKYLVLQSIVLPNGKHWAFIYDSAPNADHLSTSIAYGDIVEVIRPEGATINYAHKTAPGCTGWVGSTPLGGYTGWNSDTPYFPFDRIVTSRKTTLTDATTYQETYTWDGLLLAPFYEAKGYTNGVTYPDGTTISHTFSFMPTLTGISISDPACTSAETETDVYSGTRATPIQTTTMEYHMNENIGQTTLYNYPGLTADGSYQYVMTRSFVPILISKSTTNASGKTTKTTYEYDSGFKFTGSQPYCIYDSGAGEGSLFCKDNLGSWTANEILGSITSETVTGYSGETISSKNTTYKWQQDSNYFKANLMDLPSTETLTSSASTGSSANTFTTAYGYDESNGSPSGVYGNLTSVTKTVNSGSTVKTQTVYGSNGMPFETIDGKQNKTYINSFQCGGLFPQSVTAAYGSAVAETSTMVYDCTLGKLTSKTDPNQQTTTWGYDSMGRSTSVGYPDGGSTTISYNGDPTPPHATVTTTLNSSTSGSVVKDYHYDGLGRLTKTQLTSDPYGPVIVDTTYDGLNRVHTVSNPYRSADPTHVTTYAYDALGRKTVVTNPDATYQQWCYDGVDSSSQTNCASHIASTASEWVDFADENGNDWQQSYDALGRLTSVLEPNGTSTRPSMETDYSYDALNNLLSVNQKGNTSTDTPRTTRTFTYDGLSRLLTAFNPETGTVGYSYDANGNVLTRTDARSVTTSYSYDALNRLLRKSYSDGVTPYSCYQYDGAATAGLIGRLAAEWTLPGSQSGGCTRQAPTTGFITMRKVLAYDAMGRILSEQQCTPNASGPGNCTTSSPNPFALSYNYDLAGDLTSYTNGVNNVPFVGTIAYGLQYDGAGRLQTLNSSWAPLTSSPMNPLTLFTADPANGYTASGAIQNMVLGDNIFVNKTYDNRLRVTGETATHP